MIWLIILVGAISARAILQALRPKAQVPSVAVLFDFGARKPAPGLVLSRRDRVWNGMGSLTAAAIGIAFGEGMMVWGYRFPDSSRANEVLIGGGLLSVIVGAVLVLVGLGDVFRAPFAPVPLSVSQISCWFEGCHAGFLPTGAPWTGVGTYDFVPLRSVAHLHLVEAIARGERPVVEVDWGTGPVRRLATRVTPTSITLAPEA